MPWKKQKLAEIQRALNSDPVDIETLRSAAVSEGGLLTDDVRRKVWPKLLSINVFDLPAKPGECVSACDGQKERYELHQNSRICSASCFMTHRLRLVFLFVLK